MTAALLLTGAFTGLGAAVLVWYLSPLVPDPLAALERRRELTERYDDRGPKSRGAGDRSTMARLAADLGLGRLGADLLLLDQTPEALLRRKLAYAAVGLAFPPLLAAAMALVGSQLGVVVPAIAGLSLAGVLFLAPDLDLRRRAGAARDELRQALCAYLELVALERAADAGIGESLERAAAVGDSRFFSLARDELVHSQLVGEPPWQAFDRLARRVRVTELADISDIMRLTGEDGAAVYSTLRARAASLRGVLLAEIAARANAASEQMVVPVALLGLAFLLLLGYPAFARIVFG